LSEEIDYEEDPFEDKIESHIFGKPLQVLSFSDKNKILFDEKAVIDLLNHEMVRDRKIVAVSIVGVFRKGKSFLLDYCLRYLYGNVSENLN
jgi:hypothetical protein